MNSTISLCPLTTEKSLFYIKKQYIAENDHKMCVNLRETIHSSIKNS